MIYPKYPYQSLTEPIPAPPDDQGELCLRIDAKWRPYLLAILKQLLIERTWENDAYRATGEASILLHQIASAEFCIPDEQPGVSGDDCMGCCLRWNNGKLQILSCGEWTDVPGLQGGNVQQPSQPGEGSGGPPSPGECKDYRAVIPAHGSWLLPAVVNAGDTIHLFDFDGSTTEVGGIGRWNCQDGNLFFNGVCVPLTQYTDSTTIDPSLFTGQVIAKIAGVYYDALTPITVPSGISNEQVALMINYSPGGNYEGELVCQVELCNNAAGGYSHTFNFELSPGPWFLTDLPGGLHLGEWIAGVGWRATDGFLSSYYRRQVVIQWAGGPIEIDSVLLTMDNQQGISASGSELSQAYITNGPVFEFNLDMAHAVSGNPISLSGATHVSGVNSMQIVTQTDTDPSGTGGFTGHSVLKALTITGPGTDPF